MLRAGGWSEQNVTWCDVLQHSQVTSRAWQRIYYPREITGSKQNKLLIPVIMGMGSENARVLREIRDNGGILNSF